MKKKQFSKLIKALVYASGAAVLVSGVFFINGCKKDNTDTQVQQTVVDDGSDAMLDHILTFKNLMQTHHDNSNLKSGEQLLAINSTILDWEAAINLTYCHTNLDLAEIVVFDTVLDIPLVEGDKITVTKASEKYFNNILESIQNKYFTAEFSDKRLVSVDLEPVNGGDSLSINLIIGNPIIPYYPSGDWKYGDDLGQCDGGLYAPLDAADVLAMDVRNYFYQDPPANCRWTFTNITEYVIDRPTDYLNTNDDEIDNYCDYLIYYAIDNVTPYATDAVTCIEHDDEEAFYRQNYIYFTQKFLDDAPVFLEGKMKYQTSIYVGEEKYKDGHYYLIHKLVTKLGRRFLACTVPIEDIAQY